MGPPQDDPQTPTAVQPSESQGQDTISLSEALQLELVPGNPRAIPDITSTKANPSAAAPNSEARQLIIRRNVRQPLRNTQETNMGNASESHAEVMIIPRPPLERRYSSVEESGPTTSEGDVCAAEGDSLGSAMGSAMDSTMGSAMGSSMDSTTGSAIDSTTGSTTIGSAMDSTTTGSTTMGSTTGSITMGSTTMGSTTGSAMASAMDNTIGSTTGLNGLPSSPEGLLPHNHQSHSLQNNHQSIAQSSEQPSIAQSSKQPSIADSELAMALFRPNLGTVWPRNIPGIPSADHDTAQNPQPGTASPDYDTAPNSQPSDIPRKPVTIYLPLKIDDEFLTAYNTETGSVLHDYSTFALYNAETDTSSSKDSLWSTLKGSCKSVADYVSNSTAKEVKQEPKLPQIKLTREEIRARVSAMVVSDYDIEDMKNGICAEEYVDRINIWDELEFHLFRRTDTDIIIPDPLYVGPKWRVFYALQLWCYFRFWEDSDEPFPEGYKAFPEDAYEHFPEGYKPFPRGYKTFPEGYKTLFNRRQGRITSRSHPEPPFRLWRTIIDNLTSGDLILARRRAEVNRR